MALSTNGKWTLANAVITIVTAFMLGVSAWMASSIVELREFAARGDRFTVQDWSQQRQQLVDYVDERLGEYPPAWLLKRLERMEEEDQRLQLQVDRLEGHRPKNYTQDQ